MPRKYNSAPKLKRRTCANPRLVICDYWMSLVVLIDGRCDVLLILDDRWLWMVVVYCTCGCLLLFVFIPNLLHHNSQLVQHHLLACVCRRLPLGDANCLVSPPGYTHRQQLTCSQRSPVPRRNPCDGRKKNWRSRRRSFWPKRRRRALFVKEWNRRSTSQTRLLSANLGTMGSW